MIWPNQDRHITYADGVTVYLVDATDEHGNGRGPFAFDSTVLNTVMADAGLIAVFGDQVRSFEYLRLMAASVDTLRIGKDVIGIATANFLDDQPFNHGLMWREFAATISGGKAAIWGPGPLTDANRTRKSWDACLPPGLRQQIPQLTGGVHG